MVQDIVQGALVRIALDLESCRAVTDAEFLAWCRAVARNCGLDFLRARKREWEVRTLFEDSRDDSADGSCAAPCRARTQLLLDALQSILRREPEGAHALLWHRLVQHDTCSATAEALGISIFEQYAAAGLQYLNDRVLTAPGTFSIIFLP